MAKAIALFSGGLDSTLAIFAILRQGIDVYAVKFTTNFESNFSLRTYSKHVSSVSRKYGFGVEVVHLGQKFIETVLSPDHGYGKNMNPCIDCRILMLREINGLMDKIGADFIVTGEVLGQRPMSQRKDMLYHIDKEAGLSGYVVRPLSARLLKISVPEEKGIIDRERLYSITGRSRKAQIALAKEFGLAEYPSPAGGCLLTEPNFARRLRDLLKYKGTCDVRDIDLLKVGRHFRVGLCKIIVGRDKSENEKIESMRRGGDYLLKVEGHGSPLTLVTGHITEEALNVAASLCARYSDAKRLSDVEVTAFGTDGAMLRIKVRPAGRSLLDSCGIEKKSESLVN
ncbi:MAG: hypothetical protein AB1390_08390 [Nitrospirota bacterium]